MENKPELRQQVFGADSKIELHILSVFPEDDQYIVGRPESGEFVAVPEVGQRIISLLQQGHSISETSSCLFEEYGQEVDINEFISTFIELGFVKRIDGKLLSSDNEGGATLPWLKEQHTGWLFSRPSKTLLFALIAVAAFSIIRRPEYFPKYSDYFWSTSPTFVIVINTFMYFCTLILHEFAHLASARALNIPAKISLSTRLHNLVVQTDVSGLWSVPRNQRYQVYFAGIFSDLAIMSTAIIVVIYVPIAPIASNFLRALALICFLKIIGQFHVYMRTDMYLVCLDVLRCYNMFDDSLKYVKYMLLKLSNSLGITKIEYGNPLLSVRPHEKGRIQIYSIIMVIGSIVALWIALFYEFPITINLIVRSFRGMIDGLGGKNFVLFADGAATFVIEASFKIMFVVTFIQRHPNWFAFDRILNKVKTISRPV